MMARYKRLQLGVVGWSAIRKALGFFGHIAWQVSGWRESEAGERAGERAGGLKPIAAFDP
jgi:hypothetical protein